jgi:hypothetical protein
MGLGQDEKRPIPIGIGPEEKVDPKTIQILVSQ